MQQRRSIAIWVQRSFYLGLGLIVFTTLSMCSDPEGYTGWKYRASWINGALATYCWIAFWLAVIFKSDRSWKIVCSAILLTLGVSFAALGAIGELTK